MPREKSLTRPVQVRFHPDDVKRMTALAESEGWTWTPSAAAGPVPSVSEAVRRLVLEALDTRDAGPAVTVTRDGLRWIDAEAQREGVSRDDMVRTLLREASRARTPRYAR